MYLVSEYFFTWRSVLKAGSSAFVGRVYAVLELQNR